MSNADNLQYSNIIKFDVKSSQKHILIHEEAQFSCDICDKKFTYKWNLESHKAIHSGEKSFKCETCGSAFFRLSDLKKHTKIHTGKLLRL